jgi:hypothetical protein
VLSAGSASADAKTFAAALTGFTDAEQARVDQARSEKRRKPPGAPAKK